MKPYRDTFLNRNTRIRRFKQSVSSEELVWHRDRSDRVVKIVEGSGWQLQMDNGLPKKLVTGKEYRIPANNYHRLIKGKTDLVAEIKEDKMKITRRQIRQIIKEINANDIGSQDMADAKRYAKDKTPEGMADYLGIDVADWHRIRSELDDHYEDRFLEDQEQFDVVVPDEMFARINNIKRGDYQDHLYDIVRAIESGAPDYTLDMLLKNIGDAERMDESRINERRMATDVFKIVMRALNQGPKTHQQLLASVLDVFPNTSDEEIDSEIDKLEDAGQIIFDPRTQQYR